MAIDTQVQRQILDQVQQLAPDAVHALVLNEVRQLTSDEQLVLIQELLAMYQQSIRPKPRHNITELRGLGKEIWEGIDAQKYVDEERDSWGG